MNAFVSYFVSAMLSWSAPSLHPEAEALTRARYLDVATAVAGIVEDPKEEPLFAGPDGRARTGVLLLAIASYESGGFAADVQWCRRMGDGGKAKGLWQLHGSATACSTAHDQAAAALARVRESVTRCAATGQEAETWLAAYTSGSCDRGWLAARRRWQRAAEWMRSHPWTKT